MKDIKEYLHYYLGGPCVNSWFPDNHEMYNNDWKLKAIDLGNPKTYCLSNEEHDTWTESVKPILRKLESMTEEEAVTLFDLIGKGPSISNEAKSHQVKEMICTNKFYNGTTNLSGKDWVKIIDHLLSRGFDLFNLIPEGLALDSTQTK